MLCPLRTSPRNRNFPSLVRARKIRVSGLESSDSDSSSDSFFSDTEKDGSSSSDGDDSNASGLPDDDQ